ncbi:glycosyl hydrolases family 18-domain-containing protein [Chytriomyces sp. MP71]|nr:glycosyl hydrolases family 18-domain-containing protein [Chytriomyces sp. MP71]
MNAEPRKRLILYHANWVGYGRSFQVKDIPIACVTDVNYSFWDLRENSSGRLVPACADAWADADKRFTGVGDGVEPPDSWDDGGAPDAYYGNFGQFRKLKALGNKFRLGLSIGGWSFSKHFSTAVHSPPQREAFVREIECILDKYPGLFDRIDLDWEHISPPGKNHGDAGNTTRPDDGLNFAAFLELLHSRMQPRCVEITACLVADPAKMDALPLQAMSLYLATLNLMTYDMGSSEWGPCAAGHHTNLKSTPYAPLSVERAVEHLLRRGIPASKIVIGVAFYSRGFANTDGLGKPSHGKSTDKSWEDGIVDYKALPLPGMVESWDEAAQATFAYDAQKRILSSYDSVDSVRKKSQYVWDKGLAGIIVWESSADHPISHPRSLIAAMHAELSTPSGGQRGQPVPAAHASSIQLPPGFIQQWSDEYKRFFFVNTTTGQSQWEPPVPIATASSPHLQDSQRAHWL